MFKIDLVHVEDWAGLYVDNDLYYEGHSIPDFIWLNILKDKGIMAIDRWLDTVEDLANFGYRMPQQLTDFNL